MGQNLRYLFGLGYHPTIVFLKGFLGVHLGTGDLTHSHGSKRKPLQKVVCFSCYQTGLFGVCGTFDPAI